MSPQLKRLSKLFPAGKPGAVLWDMDGVLCATMDLHFQALRMACSVHKLNFPEEIITLGIGCSDLNNLAYILSRNGIEIGFNSSNELMIRLLNQKEKILHGLLQESQLQVTPGVLEWLDRLMKNKIPSAVASSSSMATIISILEKLGLSKYFDVLVSGANLAYGKPDPEIFIRAAMALGIAFHDCLVIEDAPVGVEAARKAGMKCLAICTSVPLERLSRAEIVVPDLQSFLPETAFR